MELERSERGQHALRIDGKYETRRDDKRGGESVRETGINLYFIANTHTLREQEREREIEGEREQGRERYCKYSSTKINRNFFYIFFIKKYKRKS